MGPDRRDKADISDDEGGEAAQAHADSLGVLGEVTEHDEGGFRDQGRSGSPDPRTDRRSPDVESEHAGD